MTTRRAAMHRAPQHASPARSSYTTLRERIESHELRLGDLRKRYLESTRTVQQSDALADTQREQDAVPQQSDGQSTSRNGCAGTGEVTVCSEVQPDNGRSQGEKAELTTAAPQAGGATNGHSPAYEYLTPERKREYDKSMQLNIGFKWTLFEIEVAYCDTNPDIIERFKRFNVPYDLEAEYAAQRARVQSAAHSPARLFKCTQQRRAAQEKPGKHKKSKKRK